MHEQCPALSLQEESRTKHAPSGPGARPWQERPHCRRAWLFVCRHTAMPTRRAPPPTTHLQAAPFHGCTTKCECRPSCHGAARQPAVCAEGRGTGSQSRVSEEFKPWAASTWTNKVMVSYREKQALKAMSIQPGQGADLCLGPRASWEAPGRRIRLQSPGHYQSTESQTSIQGNLVCRSDCPGADYLGSLIQTCTWAYPSSPRGAARQDCEFPCCSCCPLFSAPHTSQTLSPSLLCGPFLSSPLGVC